jgi:potassium large conductance calcium-activated channel subfamily M alpha protein 1
VVICGEIAALALREFFEELFHEDHENLNLHAVVLCQNPPNADMDALLRDPMYSMIITYLEGTALSQVDLKRAYAFAAESIFIMTNKFSTDPDEEDAKTILQQFSIKQYIAKMRSTEKKSPPLLCIQLIRPENRRHLVTAALKEEEAGQEDLVMCLNEIKMGVIAKAVMFQGTNTLLMNLLTSFADDDDDDDDDDHVHDEIDNLDNDSDGHWLGEYQRGCDWEIYSTELSEKFEGATFVRLAEMLYQRFGIVLFGLQIEDLKRDKSNIRVVLNPANFVIPPKRDFKIDAFVIAKNANQSDLTFSDEDAKEDENKITTGLNTAHGNADSTGGLNSTRTTNVNMNKASQKPWQELMRGMDNTVKRHGSEQERKQKVEDHYLKENYFTLDNRAKLEDCVVHTSLEEEYPLVHNHAIIVGKALSSLYDLIKNLRAKYLETLRHIVILTPMEIPYAVWSRISVFQCVLVVRGSPLDETDVLRAGIFKAAQVIVLANGIKQDDAESSRVQKAGTTALIDADAVFTYQCVRRMNEAASCVVEIVKSDNVKYLDPEAVMLNGNNVEYKFTPQFASGALLTSSLLDTLACQAFYNTKIIKVITQLFSGVERKSKAELMGVVKGDKVHKAKGVAAMVGSTLYQIPLPDLTNRTYGYLFKHLASKGIIPLGIYRGVFSHMHMGPKLNNHSYCYTNPAKDTELFSCDKVYVLSPIPLLTPHKKNIRMAKIAMTKKKGNLNLTNADVVSEINRMEEQFGGRINEMEANMNEKLAAQMRG